MNNNNLDQITMRSSKRKAIRIPQKNSNDTSMGIGEIQVFKCEKVLANSKKRIRVGNVIRLEPMVAPTFGQLKLHHNFAFCGMSDIMKSDIWNAYQTQKPVAFGSGLVQVPRQLPQASLQILSAFALVGAKWTAYQVRDNHDDALDSTTLHRFYYQAGNPQQVPAPSDALSTIRWVNETAQTPNSARNFALHLAGLSPNGMSDDQIQTALYSDNYLWSDHAYDAAMIGPGTAFEGYEGPTINIGRVFGWDTNVWIPCANSEMPLFFLPYQEDVNSTIRQYSNYRPTIDNLDPVTHENYDFLIRTRLPYGSGSDKVSVEFAVRLSDFGCRWFKLMMALVGSFDLKSTRPVDLTRFVGCHMAWFNSFGVTAYQGMETLSSRRLMAAYESNYHWDYTTLITHDDPTSPDYAGVDYVTFFKFLRDLTDMWYTEEQDYVTSHSRQAVISADNGIIDEMNASGTPNVGGVINVNVGSQTDQMIDGLDGDTTQAGSGGHAYINTVLHSQLDSEVLKRLYKVTNRNTIAGRRIADLLKAQGLGQFVKQCRSTFIGHSSVDIEIFDVTATADSTNSSDNVSSILGEYVGKGVGDGNSKWFSYKTPEVGYIYDLACVVPESGWSNSADLTAFDVKPSQQYQPEYDGLGLEISPKSVVTGVQDSYSVRDAAQPSMNEESYGFIPRFTRYKVARNIMNGAFALRSVRKGFQAFNLDKIVQVGERVIRKNWVDDNAQKSYAAAIEGKLLTASKTPIASPVYRYLGRYPWMSKFMRIFSNIGRDAWADNPYWYDEYDMSVGESEASWLLMRTDDPINVHNVFLMDYYAPVLPIEDSFETHEDGNNGPTDMAIGKA